MIHPLFVFAFCLFVSRLGSAQTAYQVFDYDMLEIDSVFVRNQVKTRTTTTSYFYNDRLSDSCSCEIRTYDPFQRIVRFELIEKEPYFDMQHGTITFCYNSLGNLELETVSDSFTLGLDLYTMLYDTLANADSTITLRSFSMNGQLTSIVAGIK
jgi:hypothetical protein